MYLNGGGVAGERRRGADLEQALLEAAWIELTTGGYSGLTMEAVAERAGTSRPVLARRWDGKAPLAIAAIRQQMLRYPLDVADRGDVRTELLEFLERASQRAEGIAAALSLFTSEYFSEVGSNPESLHSALICGEREVETQILERAVARGEVAEEKLVPPVSTLLGVLFRHHVIMNFAAPSEVLRTAWVDSIFLPLIRPDR
jgi:AcrR family transcriptional regulator